MQGGGGHLERAGGEEGEVDGVERVNSVLMYVRSIKMKLESDVDLRSL